jgi:NAD(P)-dependent dehydrogenase (short-subunit alcohol dehydrogenase family)
MPVLSVAAARVGSARIVTHSSAARLTAKVVNEEHYKKQADLEGGKLGGHSARWTRYGQTKLANLTFVQALKVCQLPDARSSMTWLPH